MLQQAYGGDCLSRKPCHEWYHRISARLNLLKLYLLILLYLVNYFIYSRSYVHTPRDAVRFAFNAVAIHVHVMN